MENNICWQGMTCIRNIMLVHNENRINDLPEYASEVPLASELYKLSWFDLRMLISEKKVSTDLLNCWGHILNRKEEDRVASLPLRFFAYVTSDGIECRYLTNYEKVSLTFFPFNYGETILICVNFITSKIEVIHTMKPKTVVYIDLVNTVRSFIEDDMVAKGKKFEGVSRFKVEEYVPKNYPIEGIDTSIHLMRNMETYAGNRRTFNNGLSACEFVLQNVRPNIILENRLKVKYCHSILTFHQNQLLNQINISAKDMRMSMRTRLACKSVAYSDEHLLKHVLGGGSNDLAKYDVVVNTNWGQATREGMSTLKPRKWVMDMVIDMYGIYSTISKPNCLYIPTTSKFIESEKDSTIGG